MDMEGTQFLAAKPEIECWSQDHQNLIIVATFGTLVYSIGLPLLVGMYLLRIHLMQRHTDPQMLAFFGFLYNKYEPHAYHYELILIIRRFSFGFISVFENSPQIQCLVAQGCLIFQFVVHTYYQVPPNIIRNLFVATSLD